MRTLNAGDVALGASPRQHIFGTLGRVAPGRAYACSQARQAQEATSLLTPKGFLPMHPVTLYIDGHKTMALRADNHGSVSYLIKPSALGLRPGRQVVDLVRVLITTTNAFRST